MTEAMARVGRASDQQARAADERLAGWSAELELVRERIATSLTQTAADRRAELEAAVANAGTTVEQWETRRREVEHSIEDATRRASQQLTGSIADHTRALERIIEERTQDLERVAEAKVAETGRVADERATGLRSLAREVEERATPVFALADNLEQRLNEQLSTVEDKLAGTRLDLQAFIEAQQRELEELAARGSQEVDNHVARRASALEKMVTERMSALNFAAEEARGQLESAREAQAAALKKFARGRAADLERLVERVQEVEDAVARRLGDLERRTVESGAALEDLLGRVGELARASSDFGRASGTTADERRLADRGVATGRPGPPGSRPGPRR
jgi:ABC-type transporter Mla subunit MlaD